MQMKQQKKPQSKPVFRTPRQVYNLWLKALRSGEYKQTRGALRDAEGFCCLGVLCDLSVKDGGKGKWNVNNRLKFDNVGSHAGMPPDKILEYIGLNSPVYVEAEKLADLNDTGKSFSQIADYIEQEVMLKALSAIKRKELI